MTGYEAGFLISDICSLAPVLAGFYFYKRLQKDRRILLFLFVYSALVELTNAWMAMHQIRNVWSINIYTLAEYSVYVFIFIHWSKDVFVRWLSLIGSVIFYTVWTGFFILNKNINLHNAPADLTESIVLMLLSGFLVTALSLKTETPVMKNYRFWFAGAVFIYFAVNILLTYLLELLTIESNNYSMSLWTIHTAINIPLYFVFAYAFSLKQL